jgi:hypothetical protein
VKYNETWFEKRRLKDSHHELINKNKKFYSCNSNFKVIISMYLILLYTYYILGFITCFGEVKSIE